MQTLLKPLTAIDLQLKPEVWTLPPGWNLWLFRGEVVFDQNIKPQFPTRLEAVERQLLIHDAESGSDVTVILPHFNAWAADFNTGDLVALLCHGLENAPAPDESLTPDFDTLHGDWSYILNLDTRTGWAAGRGVGRNRHYAWAAMIPGQLLKPKQDKELHEPLLKQIFDVHDNSCKMKKA